MVALAGATLAGCSGGGDAADTPAQGAGKRAADTRLSESGKLLTFLIHPRQPGLWAPRDDCGSVEGATEFRENLARVVLERDADGLAALAAPDIKLDFGGGSGIEELKKRLAEPDSELWSALANLVPLGCAAGPRGGLTIPWYFAQDIPLDDPYMGMIVRGADVPLLDSPRADAKVVSRLSWDAVELQGDPGIYASVKAPDGTIGFVEMAKLRSLIDYRLIAEKTAGGWKIGAFVAGD